MAAPELTPLTTADDLFHHPLPTVRLLHKQINTQLEEKNDRLRTLVGGSYRQLMGTAETIVRMRTEIREAEELLAGVGKGCGRSQIGKMVGGLGMMRPRCDAEESEFGKRARAKALENCVVVVGRLLRGKSDTNEDSSPELKLVTAAKVLVLSRLLLKSLSSDETNGKKKTGEDAHTREIEELRRRLAALRRRLLRAVERRLERVDGDVGREGLLQALCAYSLATSSGARDVMRHFLQSRGDSIASIFGEDVQREEHLGYEENQKGVVRAISLYSKTLLDIQALVPRRLADALAEQKARPLLQNGDVRNLEGLRIDVSERWFGDVILNFTPYIRHDDLDGPKAKEMLSSWAEESSEVLLKGFKQTIERVIDFKQVVELRTKTFEMWISEGGKAKGFDAETLLDGLREVVNSHLVELLKSRVDKLHIVGTEVEGALAGWSTSLSNQHSELWASHMLDMEIGNGAAKFKSSILDRSHGRNDAVSRVTNSYRTWRHLIEEVTGIVDQLKKQRWDDDIEDIEDEDSVANRQDFLSVQDPAMLQKHLETSLTSAFKSLHAKLQTILSIHEDDSNRTAFAIFLLRVLREIRADLPNLEGLKSFGLSIIPQLHDALVKSIIDEPTRILEKSFHRRKVIGRLLWEGDPALPVQPSPSIFKFIHSLNSTMAAKGSDLWSPIAIRALKKQLRSEIGRLWEEAITARDQGEKQVNGTAVVENSAPTTNGVTEEAEMPNGTAEDDSEPPPQALKDDDGDDVIMQALFDVLVLGLFLKLAGSAEADDLDGLERNLKARLNLEDASDRRLQQGSLEYWKRTNLMFGLLL